MTKRDFTPGQVAETLAIRALSFLAQEPARLGRFLAETGLGPETIRTAAKDKAFLVGVLDFILSDEGLIDDFGAANGIKPRQLIAAREALGGPTWERDVP
ncbi:DUF3572 domain-containing protein [Bradyrhizobium sp. LHD-71]|uniref:DUF3572 domain-containing protein n=1 Tax=Bradyrhizobium sp. LHD-71 TaxID=3072141 RepID=UPI00280EC4FF|nr:DUF3572 domain-containing protein [Bradyrhizobium sp. LHD-71]MDQ8726264.1 DUF3572 domain-containing protein [Bradyrhizobium sp. LHD-71]